MEKKEATITPQQSLPVKDIYTLGGGLNIEGGFPYHDLLKTSTRKTKLWVNTVVVLDRPLVDKVIFDEVLEKFTKNDYPFLENAIDELNEPRFLSFFMALLGYYVANGRQLVGLKESEQLNIVIQFHQDETCERLVEFIDEELTELCSKFGIDIHNLLIESRTDKHTYVESEHKFENTDILISLSQCAGLDPALEAGAIIIPNEFVPYDIDTKTINISKTYKVENDLVDRLDDILKSQYLKYAIESFNVGYVSANKLKKHQAGSFTKDSFSFTKILQVNKLWNPKDENEKVEIK